MTPQHSNALAGRKSMPLWSRATLGIAGILLVLMSLAALVSGQADTQTLVRAVVGLAIGICFLGAAIIGRWPNLHLGSLFM
jgi:hypothetical protein